MRRLGAATLAAVVVTAVGCSPDDAPAPATASPSSSASTPSSPGPTASVVPAWQAGDVRVRPDWLGRDAPWVWKYSDDIVVVGPRGLVALDRETGAEVWRLPLGGRVCGATRTPSELGLVALAVGRCDADGARRTTVTVVDLESASVVWERPFVGVPRLDVGGEVLLATGGCGARRLDLSTGRTLSRVDVSCSERVLVGHGVVMVSTTQAPYEWRAVDVESGLTLAEVKPPATTSDPRRILTADPLTVLARSTRDDLQLVRVDSEELRVLDVVSSVAAGAFFAWSGDSLVIADQALPGATELSADDGSSLGGFPGVAAKRWIPFDLYGDGVLGFEGDPKGLGSGRGRLTLRSLRDGSVTELGEFAGDTNLEVAAPAAVVLDDILLMRGQGNSKVRAYRLTVPEGD